MTDQCSQLLTTRRIEDEYEINPKQIRAAKKQGELSGIERGRKLYIARGEVERWIAANPSPPKKREAAHG